MNDYTSVNRHIPHDKYVVEKCSITDRECSGGCGHCFIAKERANEIYRLDKTAVLHGNTYTTNSRSTIIVAPLPLLEQAIADLHIKAGTEISHDQYDNMMLHEVYPEWETTRRIMNIDKHPTKYLYSHRSPLIAIYDDSFYIIAPRVNDYENL